MLSDEAVFQICLVGTLSLYGFMAVCAAAFYAKRSNPSIALRCPRLLGCSAGGAAVVMVAITARQAHKAQFPCLAFLVLASIFIYAYSVPYLMRLYLLRKRWEWQCAMATLAAPVLRRYDNMYAETRRSAVTAAAICFLVHALVTTFVAFTLYAEHGAAYVMSGCELHTEFFLLLSLFVVYWIIFLGALVAYGRVRDNFGIGIEMCVVGVTWLVCGSAFFITNMLPLDWDVSHLIDPVIWIFCGIGASVLVSGIAPLALAWKHRHVFTDLDLARRTMLDGDIEIECVNAMLEDDTIRARVNQEAIRRFDVPRMAFVTQTYDLLGHQVKYQDQPWNLEDGKINLESLTYLYAKYLSGVGPCGHTVRVGLSGSGNCVKDLDTIMSNLGMPVSAYIADESLRTASRTLATSFENREEVLIMVAVNMREVFLDVMASLKVAYLPFLVSSSRHTLHAQKTYMELSETV